VKQLIFKNVYIYIITLIHHCNEELKIAINKIISIEHLQFRLPGGTLDFQHTKSPTIVLRVIIYSTNVLLLRLQ